jgi:hypothetical protein
MGNLACAYNEDYITITRAQTLPVLKFFEGWRWGVEAKI